MNDVRDIEAAAEVEAPDWKRRLFLWVLPAIAVGVAVYLYGSAGRYVSTDNAYLQQDRVDVAPQVSGNVTGVMVLENAHVVIGQPLLQLDDALPKIAVAAAEARLAAARSEVLSLQAAYREKLGEIEVAQGAAAFATRELDRQSELAERKLVATATLDTARRSARLSHGAVEVLELQRDQTAARLGGKPNLPVDSYALVRTAQAELEHARLDLDHTLIRAPESGIVSHLPKVGARVDAGRPALAIVADRPPWVEANFKETDLEWVRAGNVVEIEVDTFPHHRWRGRVESISQATGATFALLPPQNASGNWVKVVQRIPVRITLERRADDPPLRYGMSADVTIDTGPHSRFDRWFGRSR